jgi:ribosomal protein S18 acetylase RimI-like enzyme
MVQTEVLKEDEWFWLRDVRLEALKQDPSAFLSVYERESDYGEHEWRAEFARGDWTVLTDQNQIVGLLGTTREPSTPQGECYLEYMWICPRFRRSGVGTDLVNAVLKQLASSGVVAVRLWILEGNEPAVRLYKKIGFSFTGESQPSRYNPSRNEELMSLSLFS